MVAASPPARLSGPKPAGKKSAKVPRSGTKEEKLLQSDEVSFCVLTLDLFADTSTHLFRYDKIVHRARSQQRRGKMNQTWRRSDQGLECVELCSTQKGAKVFARGLLLWRSCC